ncbi:MAG: hypothetical protein AAE985_07320 [Thermoplasmataceae archaeon]|jgi:outer membrane protein assembly factor BamD (BamD/ComL family)|nr:MAG: hypothetical protein AMDU2_EPLC00006G0191 [Thermoplasmatales archaeon E-plasma]MCL4347831.1 hypothetical protein [Candidatus Thermoplasmatota archaeon]
MDQKETALGTVIILLGVLFIFLRSYFVAVILIIVGGYFLYRGIRSPSDTQIAKRTNSLIYNEIYKKGIDKIRSGTMNVTEEQFNSVMEKIAWIFGRQSLMPQIGFDAVYLHFQKESEATENLERLQKDGIKASIVQDKSDWQIMIEFK